MKFTKEETLKLCLRAMNKGMALRQNQLDGIADDKSGREIIEEWFEIICNRKQDGLDI